MVDSGFSEEMIMSLTLHSPITEKDWAIISDAEFENSEEITFITPSGKNVTFCKKKNKDKGWIPCSKEMPKDEEIVLVTCATKKGVRNVNRAYYADGFWHGSGSMSQVVAWMPLPEPWKGE